MEMQAIVDAMPSVQSPCLHCEHFRDIGGMDGGGWSCTAYPEGISVDILCLDWPKPMRHTAVQSGQTGEAVYTPKVYRTAAGKDYRVLAGWKI